MPKSSKPEQNSKLSMVKQTNKNHKGNETEQAKCVISFHLLIGLPFLELFLGQVAPLRLWLQMEQLVSRILTNKSYLDIIDELIIETCNN